MATHSSILAWEIRGQTSLAGYSSWGLKELDMTKRLNKVSRSMIGPQNAKRLSL